MTKNGKTKKSRKKIFIFGIGSIIILVLIFLVIFGGNKEEILSVQTELVKKRNITQVVSATGKINPEFQVTISAEATGEIVSLPIKEGDSVKKGQLLLRIKPDIYEAQKNRAEATLQTAESNLKVRKATLDQVESEYKRVQGLYDKSLASESELELAKSSFLQRQGEFAAQEFAVIQANQSLKEANETLNKTYITSPIDGTITKLNVELGERVLGSGFSPGSVLLTVSDLSRMEATIEVDENDIVLVSVGDTANIEIDAFKDKKFKGIVSQLGNSAQTTGLGTQDEVVNFEVKILLTDKDDKIRPGMSCDADVETETRFDVLSVPIQSVTARGNVGPKPIEGNQDETSVQVNNGNKNNKKPKEVVFIVEEGKAKMLNVKTGISDDTYIEVKEGISVDQLVISGPYRAISKELEEGKIVKTQTGDKKPEKQD